MGFLTDAEQARIEDAVKKAEAGTSGEIVFALSPASGRYQHATLLGALAGMAVATTIFLMLPLAHTVARLLWTELLSFAVFYAALPFLPFRRYLITSSAMEERVREAAFMQFYSGGLYKTRESNGVEIYLSLFEKMVVVIGDNGIHAKMGEHEWDEVRDTIIGGIRAGKACQGICDAIGHCGKVLAVHFPPRPDDINELPDHVRHRK
ncbi:MAG: hypothetical protein LBP68_02730 [Acidobacteriota bacterium]|jgi:putative membrane protein|nr:hypothetical protein [Acidobacteriota bacterium]